MKILGESGSRAWEREKRGKERSPKGLHRSVAMAYIILKPQARKMSDGAVLYVV